MQNYTAIWLDEQLGLVLLSPTVGKQRDLTCLCYCLWVKLRATSHILHCCVRGNNIWLTLCLHTCTYVCMEWWVLVYICACVCVCLCAPSYMYIHSRLRWNARPQMDSVVIITKLYLQPQIWNTCSSFRAVRPDTKTKEIIAFLSNPNCVIMRFNEIEDYLISIKVWLIISDEGNKVRLVFNSVAKGLAS